MTVPSRAAAARLLRSLDPPPWHLRHSRAVAEVAGWLALRIAERAGASRASSPQPFDRRLVEAAALLHDVDKALREAQRPNLPHGEAGAAWLHEQGYGTLAEAVALHPVTRLVDGAGIAALNAARLEARVVAYADKRAAQRLVAMDQRFADWSRRHPDGWTGEVLHRAWRHALDLEAEVCGAAGCRPDEVRRLGWTAPAWAAAARPVTATPPSSPPEFR